MSSDAKFRDLKALGKRLSNWGRWGDDDEIGTLNFVTPERIAAAAGCARTGKVFNLSMPLDENGPQSGQLRVNPIRRMSVTPADWTDEPGGIIAADDLVTMSLQCATQWDGLAHVGYDGLLYNGFPGASVNSEGAAHLGIEKTVSSLVGRGVLLDIPRLRGVEKLGRTDRIDAEELTRAAERQRVEVRPGDILFVRTGWYQHFEAGEHEIYMGDQPGLDLPCCEWLHEHEVAAIAMDNVGVEARPSVLDDPGDPDTEPMSAEVVDRRDIPMHMVLIRDMGLTLGEMFDLEELARDCEEDGVYEFFYSGAPLKFTRAVGSPLSPLAIK